jgi:hypothetical protein
MKGVITIGGRQLAAAVVLEVHCEEVNMPLYKLLPKASKILGLDLHADHHHHAQRRHSMCPTRGFRHIEIVFNINRPTRIGEKIE